ncbi:M20/M25/M40 family metallo-hydrolase [Aureisphaera galaxeae]|uniref:M20/M25/M40 family metallo-hydrolase n=1 Tax=Aureisphaera galaxeae TaxID=1538023 RepID=UPI00234FC7A8|nr:M20/M25/M40 family metallo-hydrolase [Aureisphaera galaxeae]MDC8002535.1 M20/M25/M40 family metallo-hydrolase [Aureisphaera galaxeae]
MKRQLAFPSLLLLLALTYYSFFSLMPRKAVPASAPETEFSAERALVPLREISKAPHFIGNDEHARVREYLKQQLEDLGLSDVQTQDGYIYNDWGGLVRPINLMGRIKGTLPGNSLLIFAHYDSALTPSFGASDAGSGVVTILESVRAYMANGVQPKNDIIVLFTDAEEIGLDGADLFVNNHPWAKDIRLALNFEARGSGGPSNMILESNQGNHNIIQSFIDADVRFPVASSLMYSIYKMLPNDTDSTVLREDADIDGLFFAFIDDHFDYHTANDNFENLDRNTLQHQGSYLLPLLHHYADADLSNLKSDQDDVYVNLPFVNMISYPFSWILPMLLLAAIGFIVLIYLGLKNGKLEAKEIGKGFGALLTSLIVCGLIGFFGWTLLLKIYPQYQEIDHGFTYNGHTYIAFFVVLSLAITFMVYRRFKIKNIASAYIAPLFLWLLINTVVFLVIKGGAYFIIPVFFGLLALWILTRQEKPNLLLMALISAPAIFVFAPLIQFFPVGLGLEMLAISCVFTVLLFGLVYNVVGFYRGKRLFSIFFFILAFGFFISAHFESSFSEERQQPTSLLYYQNANEGKAHWVTYDNNPGEWVKGYLGESPEEASKYVVSSSGSKYNTGYTYAAPAPLINVPQFDIRLEKDTIIDNNKEVTFTLLPKRDVHILRLYADSTVVFNSLAYNGMQVPADSTGAIPRVRSNNFLMHYNVSESDSLEVSYSLPIDVEPNFSVLEYSLDLTENPLFTINKRPAHTMPLPFVTTDAVIVKKDIDLKALRAVNDTIVELLP